MFYDPVKSLLKRYGQSVSLQLPGQAPDSYSAIIQPLRYKNKMYLEGDFSLVGYITNDAYLYIGPGNKEIATCVRDARLFAGDAEYFFTRADTVMMNDKAVYTWAVIKPVLYDEGENV